MRSPAIIQARRSLRELGETALDLCCPPTCVACGTGIARPSLCERCVGRLHAVVLPQCARCGSPLAAIGIPCSQSHDPFRGIAWARNAFAYRATGGAIVRRMKFLQDLGAAAFLGRSMAAAVADRAVSLRRRSCLVSVPLHRSKLRKRGLDQAALLAEQVGQRLGIPYLPGCLGRLRATLPQGDVRVVSRSENIAGAFVLRRPRAVLGRRVILIDDVYTSCSTARECARVLREGGCVQVCLLVAARS